MNDFCSKCGLEIKDTAKSLDSGGTRVHADKCELTPLLEKLNTYIKRYPYLRVGQIICNLLNKSEFKGDVFYFPDDDLLKALEEELLEEKLQ